MTEILAPGATAVTSDSFTLGAEDAKTLNTVGPRVGNAGVWLQFQQGEEWGNAEFLEVNSIRVLQAPGTWRVARQVGNNVAVFDDE